MKPRVRLTNEPTGIGTSQGVPYTFRILDSDQRTPPRADVYRIETFVNETAPTAICRYVPGRSLDAFLHRWDEPTESVVDIRPLTAAEARAEIKAFETFGSEQAATKRGARGMAIQA
jgi:hypothetical protein